MCQFLHQHNFVESKKFNKQPLLAKSQVKTKQHLSFNGFIIQNQYQIVNKFSPFSLLFLQHFKKYFSLLFLSSPSNTKNCRFLKNIFDFQHKNLDIIKKRQCFKNKVPLKFQNQQNYPTNGVGISPTSIFNSSISKCL